MILSAATLLNISKWAYYTLRVRALSDHHKLKRWTLQLNVATSLVICAVLGPPVGFYCHGCNANIFYDGKITQLDSFHSTV